MPAPRYDVARAFINGQVAANSTRSFRVETDRILENDTVIPITVLYTYKQPLAKRYADGRIEVLPALYKRFSNTSTIHQKALLVCLSTPSWPPSK